MVDCVFVNLPVKDLKRSVDFFTKLGFKFDMKYTDENATSMIINDNAFVMLLVEKFFNSFTKKAIGNTKDSSEVIMALNVRSKKEVDEFEEKVKNAGGKIVEKYTQPAMMYGIRIEDLDRHLWEIFHMDESRIQQ